MPITAPAASVWNQRHALAARRERVLALAGAVGRPGDLWPHQWAQLMAFAADFGADLILELGRGYGNSTCAFTEVAQWDATGSARVLSLCLSTDWPARTRAEVAKVVPPEWFDRLDAREGDILGYDFAGALGGAKRVLLFWDAHGYDVAECVLGRIMPLLAGRPHVVVMHDLRDARYLPDATSSYGGQRLWRGNNWSGPRLRLGHIDTAVEQAVAALDFTSRNGVALHSADHSLRTELGADALRREELTRLLGERLFSLEASWFWFSLNEGAGPYTFPVFVPPVTPLPPEPITWTMRLKAAARIMLKRFPEERLR